MSEENQAVNAADDIRKPKGTGWQRFLALFDRGYISVPAGFLLGLFGGWLLTKYYTEKPNLSYAINPVRTSIVKSGQFSELNVSVNGKQITNDLTGVQIAVWNAGKKPIHSNDILKAVILRAVNGTPIYKATISKFRDVTEFTTSESRISFGELGLNWRILEHTDGALIQLFYAGDASTDFVLDGVTEGQDHPRRISGINRSLESKLSLGVIFFTLAASFAVDSKKLKLTRKIRLVILIFCFVGWVIWMVLNYRTTIGATLSPFGF